MRAGLQEIEIKSGVAAGGHISKVIITSEVDDGCPLYRVYIRPSWFQQFLPLRSWADRSDRVYRDLDRAILRIRELGYQRRIVLYDVADPGLARYETLAAAERTNKPLKPGKPRSPPTG